MATSILTADRFLYVADRLTASLKIEATDDTGDVEVFQRIIPFDSNGSNLPDFDKLLPIFPPNASIDFSFTVDTGDLYQALAFSRGVIPDGSSPKEDDFPLAVGRIELPSILIEHRESLLTACAGIPQIELSQDCNALRAALATGAQSTRMLLLVGDKRPRLFPSGQGDFPRFGANGDFPIAQGSSTQARRVHGVYAPSNANFATIDHITPGSSYWFIALVWTKDGRWDFAWSKDGAVDPLKQTALKRTIEVAVSQLTCVKDNTFEDDAKFFLRLEDRAGSEIASHTFTWEDMETGQIKDTPRFSLEWSTDGSSDPTSISLRAHDANHGEADLLPFPVGDGAHFSVRPLRITGINGLAGQPVFYANVKVTVSYA